MDILDKPLLRALKDGSINFYEIMNAFNIRTSLAKLNPKTRGFVYESRKGTYYLILNKDLDYKIQCETFIHEIKHITEELPKSGYIIGLDMQYTEMEIAANQFNI
jgi:hypothetical protein